MPSHTCYTRDIIELHQTGFDRFTVIYGKQVKKDLHYGAAAKELGACIMHALACEGRLDNRTRAEARNSGDAQPYYPYDDVGG